MLSSQTSNKKILSTKYNDYIPIQQLNIPSTSQYPRMYTLLAQTPEQENSIRNNLIWRQTTSMPIIKVVNFNMEPIKQSNHTNVQQFNIQLENMMKNVRDVKSLDMGQVVYLIREFLLGVQTISIKFNCEFDLNHGFFGLNSKGQAKVWISQNFIQDPVQLNWATTSLSSKKVSHIVNHLFQIVEHCIKPTYKTTFQQLYERINSEQNNTYAQAHNKLRKVSNQLGITISNSISLYQQSQRKSVNNTAKKPKYSNQKNQKRATVNRQNNASISKKMVNIVSKPLLIEQFGYRYNSPSVVPNIQNTFLSTKNQDGSNNKPKVTWRYTNSASNNINVPVSKNDKAKENLHYKIQSANNSIKRQGAFYPKLAMTNTEQKKSHIYRTVPIKLQYQKLNSQQAKIVIKQSSNQREQITIQQFNPLAETEHAETTHSYEKVQLSMENYNRIRNQMFVDKKQSTKSNWDSAMSFTMDSQFIDPMNVSKKSIATTYASSNTHRGKDSIQEFKQKCYNKVRLDEMICQNKAVANSIMISSPVISKANQKSARAYNFGGLIPIQANPSSQNTEIQGKQAESFEASIDQKLFGSHRELQLNNQNQQISSQLLHGLQMTAKLFMVNSQDLKQSVWCGAQDKRAEHLQIKLSKLGNFGRQITESIIPQ